MPSLTCIRKVLNKFWLAFFLFCAQLNAPLFENLLKKECCDRCQTKKCGYFSFQKANDFWIQKQSSSPHAKSTVRWTRHDQCWMLEYLTRNLWICVVNRRKSWWGEEGTVEAWVSEKWDGHLSMEEKRRKTTGEEWEWKVVKNLCSRRFLRIYKTVDRLRGIWTDPDRSRKLLRN